MLKINRLCTKSTSIEKISHAKAQSAAAFLKGFFAPLREKFFFPQRDEDFQAKPVIPVTSDRYVPVGFHITSQTIGF